MKNTAHPMDRTANWYSHGGLVHSGACPGVNQSSKLCTNNPHASTYLMATKCHPNLRTLMIVLSLTFHTYLPVLTSIRLLNIPDWSCYVVFLFIPGRDWYWVLLKNFHDTARGTGILTKVDFFLVYGRYKFGIDTCIS
jgi:hypothetical protein